MKLASFKKAGLTAVFLMGFTASVFAADLNSYKAQGLIGEKPNGLVGVVVPAPPQDVQNTVDQINSERLQKYQGVAAKNNLTLDKVQALAGAKLIRQSPGGHYVQDSSGKWVRK
ncbi:MAG: YdbL family protein [Pseudomonadota bacterium]